MQLYSNVKMFLRCIFHGSVDPHVELNLLRADIFSRWNKAQHDMSTSIVVMCYIKHLELQRGDCEQVVEMLTAECKKLREDLAVCNGDFEPF